MLSFTIRRALWEADEPLIRGVREAVFVREQRIPVELEWDDADASATHVLAFAENGEAIGTGRQLPSGHIGRMAVLRAYRGQGVGRALLASLLDAARANGHAEVTLSAQTQEIGFYQRMGFLPVGEVYREAGIPHQRMRLGLSR
jgi:predicted GNAT family N-acyltransferase